MKCQQMLVAVERERERERYNLTKRKIEEVSLGTIPKQARCKNLV